MSTTPGSSFSRNVDFRPYFCSALRGNGFVQNSTFCGGGYRPASLGSSRILVVDRVLNLHILRTSVQGDLTPPRSNNNTNTTAQTLSSERKHSRGSDDPLTALKKGAVLLRNGDNYYSRPKTQDFQEFCPGPPGSSQNPPFGSSSPHVLGKVVGSSIPQPRSIWYSRIHTG